MADRVAASYESWEWQEGGLCRQRDENLFIGPDREGAAARRRRERRAKSVCAACPILGRCRRHALDAREPHGVWGGLTEQERHSILNAPSSITGAPAGESAPDDDAVSWFRTHYDLSVYRAPAVHAGDGTPTARCFGAPQ